MDTMRLIIILLMINMVIGLSMEFYDNNTAISYDSLEDTYGISDYARDRFNSEEGNIQGLELNEEGGFGSAMRMGATLFKIMGVGMKPIGNDRYVEDPATDLLFTFLKIFRTLLWVLIAIQGFLLWKNRKTE